MDEALLAGGTIRTSQLGFGTSVLMGRVSAAASRRALDTAFAAGITHFDTARAYGYGEAERVVGHFIRDKRRQVTVTTKAGIRPPARSTLLSTLRVIAKGVVALAPSLRQTVRRTAARAVAPGQFDVAAITASLEMSLRELDTDYIDLFLLHECRPSDLNDELFSALESFVQAGKIRAFGIGTQREATHEIVESQQRFAAVVQVANSLARPADRAVRAVPFISHSIFAGDLEAIAALVPARNERATSAGDVRRAMLEYALRSNPHGVTLFSSTNPTHIDDNARNARASRRFSDVELDALVAGLSS